MRTVMERLRDGLDGFPATERRVAHRILADYPVAGLQSASDLARDVGVSAPSVLRMVSRMGFASYPDFQRVMREELTAQLSSPLSKSPAATRRQMGTTVAPRLQKFVTVLEGNLHETFTHLPTAEFDRVVRLLADRRLRLHLIGGRFTDALARYLSAQLRIVRPGVNHLEDQEDNWYDQVLDMGKRDVLIVFDIRRYQPSLLRLAEAAAKRQARLVLVTDQWLSPISRLAAHVLPARVAVPSVWDSSVALMAIVEALLAEATQLDWEYGQKRMRELEAVRDAAPSSAKAVSAAKKAPVRRGAAGKR
ncbi:MurR/RpiR family transcriptional regulator [Pseudoxanthomonas sp. UTMC 1351]|uniref:MurR/RpiR family transcriptional regulator n=1 Tax=Pseudoxanthomonas sp. UTMC 1351 TaxID=2695853 RepID=UPI0034CF9AA0